MSDVRQSSSYFPLKIDQRTLCCSMDSDQIPTNRFIEEATGRVPSKHYPAEQRIYLVQELLGSQISPEELSNREGYPLGAFLSWLHAFLSAGEERIIEMTVKTPWVDTRQKIEIVLSEPSYFQIHETMHRDFVRSENTVVEHALFLQWYFLTTRNSRTDLDCLKYRERLRTLTEESKADGTYDTAVFSEKICSLCIDINYEDEFFQFWDRRPDDVLGDLPLGRLKEDEEAAFPEELRDRLYAEADEARRRISLVKKVLVKNFTAHRLSRRERMPLRQFYEWYDAFMLAAKERVRHITYKTPPVDGKYRLELLLSEPYYAQIQQTKFRNFFCSESDVIEHALFLQKHFRITKQARRKESRRK